jgi:hypothetical protein
VRRRIEAALSLLADKHESLTRTVEDVLKELKYGAQNADCANRKLNSEVKLLFERSKYGRANDHRKGDGPAPQEHSLQIHNSERLPSVETDWPEHGRSTSAVTERSSVNPVAHSR